MTNETLERAIVITLEDSAIQLTAGAILRILERTVSGLPSRTTIQKRLDAMAERGAIECSERTIEINGFVRPARHYTKRTEVTT